MCTIAGYAGIRRAAPILIEMLRREEYIDGGLSTGIATIHEGKLYTRKVTGDLEELLRTTDALDLPGTVGIIHSRTAGNLVSHAHPFTSEDGDLALVLNGTMREVMSEGFANESNRIMKEFYERGFTIKTACDIPEDYKGYRRLPNGKGYHDSEPYALMIGDMVSKSEQATLRADLAKATHDALSKLPADIVVLGVHARLDDTVTVGTVTRPMNCGFADDGFYLSTVALAFPEEVQKNPILPIPPTTVAQMTKDGITFARTSVDGVRVQQIDYRIAASVYTRMEKLLKGQKDDPKSLYDMPCYTDWRDVWSEPSVDCRFAAEGGLLKPYATILYEALWAFHKEGRLHSVIGERKGKKITKFWID